MRYWLALLLLLTTPVWGLDTDRLPDAAQEERARALMQELRCLVCQNQSIAESDADLARDLRVIVREQVASGRSDSEIKAYLVARYGDWILLKPPFTPATWLLWCAPLLVLAGGSLIAWRMLRRPVVQPAPLTDEEQHAAEEALR